MSIEERLRQMAEAPAFGYTKSDLIAAANHIAALEERNTSLKSEIIASDNQIFAANIRANNAEATTIAIQDALTAVLCDPSGQVAIIGSERDREIIHENLTLPIHEDTWKTERTKLFDIITSLEKDRERLDWLEKNKVTNVPSHRMSIYFQHAGDVIHDNLRAAIDAAMNPKENEE